MSDGPNTSGQSNLTVGWWMKGGGKSERSDMVSLRSLHWTCIVEENIYVVICKFRSVGNVLMMDGVRVYHVTYL